MTQTFLIDEILLLCKKLMDDSNFEEVTFLCEQCLKLEQRHPDLLSYLGQAQVALEQFDEGISSLQEAFNTNPHDLNILISLGNAFLLAKRFDECAEFFNPLVQTESIFACHQDVQIIYARSLISKHDTANALPLLKKIFDCFGNSDALVQCTLQFTEQIEKTMGHGESNKVLDILATDQFLLPDTAMALLKRSCREHGLDHAWSVGSTLLVRSKYPMDFLEKLLRFIDIAGGTKEAVQSADSVMKSGHGTTGIRKFLQSKTSARSDISMKRCVVFLEPNPRARTMKIAGALRRIGWHTVLLHYGDLYFNSASYFDECHAFVNLEQALGLSLQYSGAIFHLCSGNADPYCVGFIKERLGPTVYDPYDVVEGNIRQHYSNEVGMLQRYCFENADGINCRDLRIRHAHRAIGYHIPGKIIFFPDYLDRVTGPSEPLRAHDDKNISVVFAGSIVTRKHQHEIDWGMFNIAEAFANQGVHLHLYPSETSLVGHDFEEIFEEFSSLGQTTGMVTVHRPVPMDQLSNELRSYQFGFCGLWDQIFSRSNPYYTGIGPQKCLSSRCIDYLEAGLGLLLPTAIQTLHRFYARVGVAHTVTPEFMRNVRNELSDLVRSTSFVGQFEKAQQTYLIDNHIRRLSSFYDQLQQ